MSIGSVFETAYKGDFNQVKVKVDEDLVLIRTPDTNGRLLIHWAALGGNESLVEFLVDNGSPVDPQDDTYSTPLVLAASAGRYEVVRYLLSKNADVNHKTTRRQTALHYACSKGHKDVVKLLINCDALVNEIDILGATPLHRAAAQGRTEIVEILLKTPQIKLNLCDSTGSTPLHLACEEDRKTVITMLVEAGADMDIKNKENKTPLDLCSTSLRTLILKLKE
ncbi:26S proteasome non-ATPase regulatory subunit 10-like [Leptidea sinapis]|uniref:26S proteasome non-ATPase regulatory subunit 10-like n=1 Tax=Leptidea sinapis TaxID=189913 RepID=UPI0021266A0F|nr:26S proteasome non-ATPase regulatory subunit 10-like [Leptidea sinapis]